LNLRLLDRKNKTQILQEVHMTSFHQIKFFSTLLILIFLSVSCQTKSKESAVSSSESAYMKVYKLKQAPVVAKTRAFQTLPIGGLSALQWMPKSTDLPVDVLQDPNILVFQAITDRGPNGLEVEVQAKKETIKARPFLVQDFAPQLVTLKVKKDSDRFEVISMVPFYDQNKKPINGLPPSEKNKNSETKYENAVDLFGKTLKQSGFGMDSEGFCRTQDAIYVSDEYGPFLLKFDLQRNLQKVWSPGQGLPAEMALRKMNRGFEGLTCDEKFVYVMLQSPLKSDRSQDQGKIRLVQFNPATGKTEKEFFYPVDEKRADKIGDIALLGNNRILVLEQNGALNEKGVQDLYVIDLSKVDVQGVLVKTKVLDLNKLGLNFAEKIEGLTVIDSNTVALLTDNDFGLSGPVDFKSGRVDIRQSDSYLIVIALEKDL
jgi:hypothetical protein